MSLDLTVTSFSSNTHVISEGDNVLAYSPDQKRYHPIKIQSGVPAKLWKYTVNPGGAIGHLYGSKFVIRGSNLELLNPRKLEGKIEVRMSSGESVRDNRHLLDVATNQKFSNEEIDQLKERELEPEELIGEILSGSSTFSDKTEYSQQKYISKKKAKHMPIIYIYQPSFRHLALMHYRLSPDKIGYLRIDTLSQLLSLANVRHGARLLVIDNFGGLVIGAALERMGGGGSLVELFTTEIVHPRKVLSSFSHLSPQHWDCLSAFPLRKLSRLGESEHEDSHLEPTTVVESESLHSSDMALDLDRSFTPDSVGGNPSALDSDLAQPVQPPSLAKTDRYSTARKVLLEGEFDAFILATKHNPIPILELCLPFIFPSRPLVVYCVFSELISACYEYFYRSASIKLTELSTSWLRAYQPLESRLHPEMTSTSSRTGYILHGVRVKTYDDAVPSQKTPLPPNQGSTESKRIKLV